MSTEAIEVLTWLAAGMLVGMLVALRLVVRRQDAPLELYQPGDVWAVKGRRPGDAWASRWDPLRPIPPRRAERVPFQRPRASRPSGGWEGVERLRLTERIGDVMRRAAAWVMRRRGR